MASERFLLLWHFCGKRLCKYSVCLTQKLLVKRDPHGSKLSNQRSCVQFDSWSEGGGMFPRRSYRNVWLNFCVLYFYNKDLMKNGLLRGCELVFSVFRLFKWRRRLSLTHHLCVVRIEGLFIQREFLGTQGVVELNHLRKLQETNKTVTSHYLSSAGFQEIHLCAHRMTSCDPRTARPSLTVEVWIEGKSNPSRGYLMSTGEVFMLLSVHNGNLLKCFPH